MTYDLLVIGAGPAGYICAIHAAKLGLKVACVEKRKELGGTCLNVGCIPSKALLQSSELYSKILHHTAQHGISVKGVSYDFGAMMQRKSKILSDFNLGIQALFKAHKITRYTGHATFISPTCVELDSKEQIEAKNIVIATGSEPISLPFLPLDEKRIVSSTGALSFSEVPKKLLVVGAGIIGVELGSVYRRLGSEVTFIEFLDTICPTLDAALSKELYQSLKKQGMAFHLSSKVVDAKIGPSITLTVQKEGKEEHFTGDSVLVSIGRRPYTHNLGLDKVGIKTDAKGMISVSNHFRTNVPNIYAIGDVIDGPMLAHKGSEEGMVVAEIIAGHASYFDYITIPNVVYTDPEVGSVGITAKQASELGLEVKTATFSFKINSRARCMGEEEGFVKILAEKGSDRLLGIHIIGAHASELVAIGSLAIQKRMTAKELSKACFAHPTLSEVLKEGALALH